MSNLAKLAMSLGLKFGPVRKGVTPRKVLEHILNGMVMLEADHKLVTEPHQVARYGGMMEAYKDIAHYIAPYREIPAKTVRAKVSK